MDSPIGSVVWDERRRRAGEVMEVRGDRVWLRPLGGGREWEAPPDALAAPPATDTAARPSPDGTAGQ